VKSPDRPEFQRRALAPAGCAAGFVFGVRPPLISDKSTSVSGLHLRLLLRRQQGVFRLQREIPSWRDPGPRCFLPGRPLTGFHQGQLNGQDGRKAERPVLCATAIRHGVVWPRAEWPLRSGTAGKADRRLPPQTGCPDHLRRFPKTTVRQPLGTFGLPLICHRPLPLASVGS